MRSYPCLSCSLYRFVSDVNPSDLCSLLSSLENHSTFFGTAFNPTREQADAILELVKRWKSYFDEGKFSLSVPPDLRLGQPSEADYWTTPYSYFDMASDAKDLWEDLGKSALVIFKGDLK